MTDNKGKFIERKNLNKESNANSQSGILSNGESKVPLEGEESIAPKNKDEDSDEEFQIPGANNLW